MATVEHARRLVEEEKQVVLDNRHFDAVRRHLYTELNHAGMTKGEYHQLYLVGEIAILERNRLKNRGISSDLYEILVDWGIPDIQIGIFLTGYQTMREIGEGEAKGTLNPQEAGNYRCEFGPPRIRCRGQKQDFAHYPWLIPQRPQVNNLHLQDHI